MTRVAIIGAHGRVAQQLMRLLYDDGDDFVGVVRSEDHADDIYRFGGEGVLLDIEHAEPEQLAHAIEGCDAVVFAAGAGPDSGPARKATVDYGGSVKSQRAAELAGIKRFVQVSAMGVDDQVADDATESWRAYVDAKRDADIALRGSGLDWTILRPGALTLDDGTGLIEAGERVARGSIPREDVAHVIVTTLRDEATVGIQFEFVSGATPIDDAVRAVAEAGHGGPTAS
ncbi:SDR family oxidoreductase [Humibacter ginsenosidimutans]|uniref:SDR family oxidoreductase n=1 Tax=Humibacter ginsenosidimutans TaxID=2599293 RepID=A0A5B8M273_9MICO|nr:SDR family oxidoreductase [Humibacter ginsenosidimutans]QDZ14054.1 SDR family oxidoreductase [Humibacter ginsenosidimutans]